LDGSQPVSVALSVRWLGVALAGGLDGRKDSEPDGDERAGDDPADRCVEDGGGVNEASDEERSPYVDDDKLELSAWARDAVVLALPDKILCRPDCAGLCDVCGKNLNDEPHTHEEEHSDPRWAALEALREQP